MDTSLVRTVKLSKAAHAAPAVRQVARWGVLHVRSAQSLEGDGAMNALFDLYSQKFIPVRKRRFVCPVSHLFPLAWNGSPLLPLTLFCLLFPCLSNFAL
jgi:hypothetical protein